MISIVSFGEDFCIMVRRAATLTEILHWSEFLREPAQSVGVMIDPGEVEPQSLSSIKEYGIPVNIMFSCQNHQSHYEDGGGLS